MSQQQLELPKGWIIKKISELTKSYSGGTPSTSVKDYWNSNDVPWIKSGEIKDNIIKESQSFIAKKGYENSSAKLYPKETILVAITGATTGKTAYLLTGACGTQNVFGILPCESIFQKYLWYFMRNYYSKMLAKVIGTAQKHVNGTIIKNTPIPLPPLNEQKRIVSKIEELFSKIDSTKQSLEHTKLQLEQYRHSLLKSAFEGKLTEKWREQNNIKQGYRSDVLGNLILFSKNGFTGKPNESKKGIPRLGIETITQSDSIYVNETMHKFIEIPTSKIDRYRAKEGDLFVCRQNGNQNYVGKCAIFKEIISPMIFSDSLIQFRVNMKLIFPAYLAFFINSHLGNNQLEKFRTTTAGNFSINGTNMKKIIIEHPSIEEQKQIVSQIEQDFSLIENTSQIVNSTLQQLETMKISILKQAFSGKLVS